MAESQVPYPYTAHSVAALDVSLSLPRMATYLSLAGRDKGWAMRLYLWNAQLSKALRFPLEIAEVTLRNRIALCLSDRYGRNWPHDATFHGHMAEKTKDKLVDAITTLGTGASIDDIVARMDFGFWTALLENRFVEHLWRGRLSNAFPNLPEATQQLLLADQLATVDAAAKDVKWLRNRISHLRPIARLDISKRHTEVIQFIRILCRSTSEWTLHHSTVERVRRSRPQKTPDDHRALTRGVKQFPCIKASEPVATALTALKTSPHPFVVLVTDGSHVLITGDDLGKWLCSSVEMGLVDLAMPLSDVLSVAANTVFAARSASLAEVARKLQGAFGAGCSWRPRGAIVTENGKPHETPLAVIDAVDVHQ